MTPEMKAKAEQAAATASALYEKDLSTTPEHEAAVLKCGHYDGFIAGAEWQAANSPELGEDPTASIADDIIHRLNEFTVSDAIRIAACKGRQYGGELARREAAEQLAADQAEIIRLRSLVVDRDAEIDWLRGEVNNITGQGRMWYAEKFKKENLRHK